MSGRLDGKVCPQDVWVSARDGLWHFDGMCLPVRLRRAVKFIAFSASVARQTLIGSKEGTERLFAYPLACMLCRKRS